jgi:hypothetical protein
MGACIVQIEVTSSDIIPAVGLIEYVLNTWISYLATATLLGHHFRHATLSNRFQLWIVSLQ